MAKRCRQLCIVLFVTLWFIIAEGSFCKLVHAELLQEKSEESDFAEDMDEALSELDLSDLEQFVSDNLSKTHIGFGELVRNLIHADRPISFSKLLSDIASVLIGEVQENRTQAVSILLLVVCSAVLSSIASVFDSDQSLCTCRICSELSSCDELS